MSRTLFLMALIAAGVTTMPAGVHAQTAAATIPRDVMAVLLQGPELTAGGFELRLASAPMGFPKDLLPAAARVAAAAVTPAATTLVATLAQFSNADQAALESSLLASGWTDEHARPRGMNAPPSGLPIVVCRGADFATVTFAPRESGGVFVRAVVARDAGRACVARRVSTYGDVPLPSLRPPTGALSSAAGIGGNLDAMYSSVRLQTSDAVSAITAHYASQLVAAGWRIEGQSSEADAMAVTRLTGRSTTGEPMSGVLVITTLGSSGQKDVLLRIVRNTPSASAGIVR